MIRARLDTCFVLRLFDAADPLYPVVGASTAAFIQQGGVFVVSPQVFMRRESSSRAQSPTNGRGRDASEFAALVGSLRGYTTLLPDPVDLVDRGIALCDRHHVVGKRRRDARLVAWTEAYGVDTQLTLNPGDFRTFRSIRVLAPEG